MSQSNIPIRGDLDLVCDICGLVGTDATSRDMITEGYQKNDSTIKRAIRYSSLLGLMEEAEDGVKATDLGLDLAQTKPEEERRAQEFRRIIAQDDEYASLVNSLLRNIADDRVERRDVDKQLRVGMNLDVSDHSRKRASTTFLQTVEAAGVGEYKKGSRNSVSRLEITDDKALEDLLTRINDDSESSSQKTNHSQEQPQNQPSEPPVNVDDSSPRQPYNRPSTAREAPMGMPKATFDIQLELDGTENPQQIRALVTAVREGLKPEDRNQEKDTHSESDIGSEASEPSSEGKKDSEEPSEENPADSSLGDFS